MDTQSSNCKGSYDNDGKQVHLDNIKKINDPMTGFIDNEKQCIFLDVSQLNLGFTSLCVIQVFYVA